MTRDIDSAGDERSSVVGRSEWALVWERLRR